MEHLQTEIIPQHIAIIMDGNGRWAQRQGLPRGEGHRQGGENVKKITGVCSELGVKQLTLYCLSSENWKRPKDEIDFLMALLKFYMIQERETLINNNIRMKIIGRRQPIPGEVLAEMDETVRATSSNTGLTLCLAINYGSRAEIVDAVRSIVQDLADESLRQKMLQKSGATQWSDLIDEELIASRLYTADSPDLDLLIRTGNEFRLSNYLLWQLSYSEIYISKVCWPDFDRVELLKAIEAFQNRDRRFGGLK